ncbi:hypothetical protein OEV82_15225 [Caldibacillus thermolactis]|uniref:Uncharacterized protein n=1 Tax=Pallidibacillus thermolactis TaxID=251051 RepID=A0ABT2WJ98_9BACI|nr:hypothetical protein [Pallidibacillus thermolactis]MCU9595776.1 hypothetical protein [Pallidibacillus thermolactis]
MEEISRNIGTVHDLDEFALIAELEDYYYKQKNREVEIELLQGKNTTEGLLNIKIVGKNGQETILDADESLQLIERVTSIKVDEVYVNFAGHIVYLIDLK